MWTNLAYVNRPCTISHVQNKGLGLIATRRIEAGELVLQERPLFRLWQPEPSHADILHQVTRLSPADREEFYSLANSEDDDVSEEKGINFTMFLTMMSERLVQFDPENELVEAFACFDENDDGTVKQSKSCARNPIHVADVVISKALVLFRGIGWKPLRSKIRSLDMLHF